MTRHCKDCGAEIQRKHDKGRPPMYCESCAEKRIKVSNKKTCQAWYARKSQDPEWRENKRMQAQLWRAKKQQAA